MFINRVGEIKQSGGGLDDDLATVEDAAQWYVFCGCTTASLNIIPHIGSSW